MTHRKQAVGIGLGTALMLAVGTVGAVTAVARAQGLSTATAAAPSPTQLKREALSKMLRQIPEVNFTDQTLESVLTFIGEITGAELEPVWIDDRAIDGLDKETLISLTAKRISALQLLELVLDRAAADSGSFTGGNTWQMTDWGTIEIGPKEALARRMRLEIYPIGDLLWEIPDYPEAPDIDLQSVLQSSQGGGGGQSPFRDDQQDDQDRVPLEERAEEIMDIIQQLVEPEQWLTGGGTATIRYFQNSLLVRAPDFVHRQLGGYPWWPSAATKATIVNGRRYVSLDVDTSIATVDDLVNQPVSAVVGGRPGGGP